MGKGATGFLWKNVMNFVIAMCVLYFAGWAVKKLWETSYSRRTGRPAEDLWRTPTPEEIAQREEARRARYNYELQCGFERLRKAHLEKHEPLPAYLQTFEAYKEWEARLHVCPAVPPGGLPCDYPGGTRAFYAAGSPPFSAWPKPTSAERQTGITPSSKIQQACVAPCVELPVAESKTQISSGNAENVDEWPGIRLVRTSPPEVGATIDAKDVITAFGYGEGGRFNLITRKQFGTMLLRRKELDGAFQIGKSLSVEEQKERVILHFMLGTPGGGPGEEPVIRLHKWRLEYVRGFRVIGDFTFGDVERYAASHDGVLALFKGIYEGDLTIKEAEQALEAMKKWDELKDRTEPSKQQFLNKELAAIVGTGKEQPSNN